MKTIRKYISVLACAAIIAGAFSSCKDETPFSESDGEGLVRLSVSVNSKLTRSMATKAETPDNEAELRDNCRIYISNAKGVLHKWIGVDDMPESIYLRYGSYVAEAMAGDSVSASFDKKYFKGMSPFEVSATNATTQVSVACKLANVVASIEQSTVDSKYVRDLVLTVSNSRGELVFDNSRYMDKGYFMMPNGDSELNYTVEGKNLAGDTFKETGTIANVKPAHDYRFNFEFNPSESVDGGAFVDIIIEDVPLIESDVVIQAKPTFVWSNSDLAIDDQIQGVKGDFSDMKLLIGTFGDAKTVVLSTSIPNLLGSNMSLDLLGNPEAISATGIRLEDLGNKMVNGVLTHRYSVDFAADWFNNLAESTDEYVVNVAVEDSNGKTARMDVRVANMKEAYTYKAPVIVNIELLRSDFMAVGARSMTVPVEVVAEVGTNYCVEYCKDGENDWTSVPAQFDTRAAGIGYARLTGLTPGTTYKLRTSYEINGAKTESSSVNIITESEFDIPNAGFEEWSTYSAKTMLGPKNVVLPFAGGDKMTAFWGSGNEGAATANMTLTDKNAEMLHSGTYSARLESKAAMGIIAAGNIFVGHYDRTDGTNGVLQVGREYNGSHPAKLRVYANYRPASGAQVKDNGGGVVEIEAGGLDQGQIYVALTTAPREIRTKASDRQLFDRDDESVLAYGEVTWKGNFGADGQLELVEIPLEYKDSAKTTELTHLVIVCSASKFGDYFCGSTGSVMYLDDFELVYE